MNKRDINVAAPCTVLSHTSPVFLGFSIFQKKSLKPLLGLISIFILGDPVGKQE